MSVKTPSFALDEDGQPVKAEYIKVRTKRPYVYAMIGMKLTKEQIAAEMKQGIQKLIESGQVPDELMDQIEDVDMDELIDRFTQEAFDDDDDDDDTEHVGGIPLQLCLN